MPKKKIPTKFVRKLANALDKRGVVYKLDIGTVIST